MATSSTFSSPLLRRALVLGALAGAGLVLLAVFSNRGPLLFLPYAALFVALAPLLARYRSEGFAGRALAALAAFGAATLISYLHIRIWVNPGLPQISLVNAARFALVFGCGGVLSLAIAYVTGGDAPHAPTTAT